ncbi:Lysine exporter protein (LYSE/YGGA) [Desulfovibrio sp. X2]|uniref:LysE/ArgO family amino acid transporter n=1 Tax=Desulfovibrio sp. X2 TaxID=941449 RepID=UPI0003587AC3|nr:LysE family transporter [Desulfovibrio sp. X2]EPR37331.1 Lysine exporter protein (LYSE/YGGA) [Desulfovibrio sp. X2]
MAVSSFPFLPFLQGFGTGCGLIVAIGAQNAFVLSQGIRRQHHLPVALVCSLCDAALIALGVAGAGAALAASPLVRQAAALGGAAFLAFYGLRSARAAVAGGGALTAAPESGEGGGQEKGLVATLLVTLAVTLLNPHVYVDTVLLLGGIGAQYPLPARWLFGAGAALASCTWFFSLVLCGRLLAPLLARPGAWRVLDGIIACIMWSVAAGLLSMSFAR